MGVIDKDQHAQSGAKGADLRLKQGTPIRSLLPEGELTTDVVLALYSMLHTM